MPLFTKSKMNQVAGSFICTPISYEWMDRQVFLGLDTDSMIETDPAFIVDNLLVEAFTQIDEIPAVGDPHREYEDCCCSGVEIRAAPGAKGPDSSDGVHVDVKWLQARKDRDGNRTRKVVCEPYQVQEVRNFDVHGDRTKVYYNLNNPDPRFPPYRIADIRVPRSMHSVRFTQYENMAGKEVADLAGPGAPSLFPLGWKLPIYNDSQWNGFSRNTLLFLGRRVISDGMPICLVEYHFLTNDRGWNKFISVYTQQNGYVPKDLDDLPPEALDPDTDASALLQNGIGAFNMLPSADFSSAIPQVANRSL